MSEPLSRRNPEVARLRALARQRSARREAGRFVVEGVKLVTEVVASDLVVLDVFVDAEWHMPAELTGMLAVADIDVRPLASGGIERIASTTSPQPIVAEVVLPRTDWSVLASPSALLVAVDLNDPGNVGTLARSAIAAGFDGLIALGETADPFGPKAIRASAGAVFRVAVVIGADVVTGLEHLASMGVERLGTRMDDAEACDRTDLSGPITLVLGSEAHGLDVSHVTCIDRWVQVPMAGDIESLNVAMAGTILTYEVARQRRAAS